MGGQLFLGLLEPRGNQRRGLLRRCGDRGEKGDPPGGLGEVVGRTKRAVMKRNRTEAQELYNMALASSVSKVTQSTSLKMSVKSFFFFSGIYRFIWRVDIFTL